MRKRIGEARAEERLELDAKPRPNGERSLSFLESQPAPQGFDDGKEEKLIAVGDAVSFEPGHGVSGEPSQLAQKPRLADAGVPEQEEHLPAPGE